MVETLPKQFKKNASRQLADEDLRKALTKSKGHFTGGRQKAMDNLPEFDSLRDKFQKANFATGETPNRFGMILGEVAMRSGHQWLNDLLIYIEKNKKIFDNEINKLNTLVSMKIDSTYLAWVDFTKTGDTENNNFQKLNLLINKKQLSKKMSIFNNYLMIVS